MSTKLNKSELRKFGITIFIALTALSGIILWRKGEYGFIPLGIGLLLLICGSVCPEKLRPVYKGWMTFAFILGFITSHIILAVVYYLAFTPIGFAMKIAGKKKLGINSDKPAETYWVRREAKEASQKQYEKMF